MANYPKELLDLLEEYLTDGYIDDAERQVLCNKAHSMGIDPMEFNLYIKSQEQKIEFAKKEALNKEKGRLCPYCQQPLPMLADTCPHCNQAVTVEASKEVEELINQLENALENLKTIGAKKKQETVLTLEKGMKAYFRFALIFPMFMQSSKNSTDELYAKYKSEVERHTRKSKMYYANNKTMNFLIEEAEKEVAQIEESIAKEKKRNKMIILGIVAFYVILFGSVMFTDTRSTSEIESDFVTEVVELVNNGELAEADQMLTSHNIPKGFSGKGYGEEEYPDDIVKKYDAAFLAVVNAYLNNNNYDAAEAIAGAYKSKINNIYSWRRSSVYAKLKSYCDKNDIDFSVLDSESGSSSSSGRELSSESSSSSYGARRSSYDDKEDEYSYDDEEDSYSYDDEEDSYNSYEDIENAAQEIANEVYESYGSYSGW